MSQSSSSPRRCVVCKGMDAIVLLEACGHAFHSRCIFEWPIQACEVCQTPCDSIALVGRCRAFPSSPPRAAPGTAAATRRSWDEAEREYCMLLMDLFKEGSLPLKSGMHLRQTLAMLLNCNPMRITKKFKQQDQLGKQTYSYHPTPAGANYKRHVQRQKQLTMLRDSFYWQLKMQGGNAMEMIREAEVDFWLSQIVSFASAVGQSVSATSMPMPTTPPPVKFDPTESPLTVECYVEQYMPCLSQMDWEIMEELKLQNTDPLPWSGQLDDLSISVIDDDGCLLLEKMTVDESIWSN
ncbi:hypothetical protein LEN26_015497 [Aphanomyces euteiches]|nr:hypothetical protein LEN26_015497 [Aphanomyces euteiches]KAH9105161.1 hypothetical protein AeMF1_018938 [Aphanomyces euteiches]KAH9190794.1 hypothetical protein AeNC1_007231 [Aphanomyces euteiches]